MQCIQLDPVRWPTSRRLSQLTYANQIACRRLIQLTYVNLITYIQNSKSKCENVTFARKSSAASTLSQMKIKGCNSDNNVYIYIHIRFLSLTLTPINRSNASAKWFSPSKIIHSIFFRCHQHFSFSANLRTSSIPNNK